MQRIMIIGSGGSGKSTLATTLGQRLSLPVHHLDRIFWRAGWQSMPRAEFVQRQAELVARPQWIIDGNYDSTLQVRFAAADTVVFLDLHPLLCLWRVIRRWWRYRGRSRPDLSEGCPEKLEFEFLKWILTFRKHARSGILAALAEPSPTGRALIHLRSRREIAAWLDSIPQRQPTKVVREQV
jgi:adenylate kinase family enzyme